jgi:hypothetical protein
VLGATATASGNFLTPMMLGMVAGSFVSGQMLSRVGGHYRIQGAIGLAVMGAGLALLSRMTAETSYSTAVVNMVITGLGLGITMPLYTIAVQNAVPYSMLGVATSSTAFFRSIGGSVGLAIFGSVMNNRFAADLMAKIPAGVKVMIPPQQLDALIHNPEALMSPEAQLQLQRIIERIDPQSTVLLNQVLQALRQSLDTALSQVFLYAAIAVAVSFLINFFIKEIPLRKHHTLDNSD